MSRPSKRKKRPRWILYFFSSVAVFLPFMLSARGLLASPLGVTEFRGDLYEFDMNTGAYHLAVPLDPPVECGPLTGTGDAIFCADPEQFEGTWVRRLERSSASVVWEVNFSDLPFPAGIAYEEPLLYLVAYENAPRRYFLLNLDPATGEELARIEIPELGAFQRVFALAVRGSTPWLLTDGDFTGMSVVRLDPLTGSLHESFTIPGVFVAIDAEFGPGGRLFLSDMEWNPIGTGWCTDHWTVPFLGASPELRFTHCWEEPDPPPPDLAYFTLGAPPLVEIPTLNATAAGVLVVLLALAGVLAVRRRAGDVSAR